MARNTKEVSLIQIRSGKLSEMPKALHQSEYGLAKDANRLFIGNASNPLLKNRTIFPYQNLELLTEFSDLKDYFKYSYENNITSANGISDRLLLKEFLPIVISCHQPNPSIVSAGSITINSRPISMPVGNTQSIISTINSESINTGVYATVFPGTNVITFVSTKNELRIEPTDPDNPNDTGIITAIGFIEESYDISMPVRKITEKLDDQLNITDFGIKGDGTNVQDKVFNALIEVYKNISNSQFYRNVFFPAGTYTFDDTDDGYFAPFPIISNLHVHGEGIDRTIISNNTTKTLLSCVDNEFYAEYSYNNYGQGGFPSNIVIEDMTFSSSVVNADTLCKLIGCSNVTFNRVKFTGNLANTLLLVEGKELNSFNPITQQEELTEHDSFNITFNECIFENAETAIDISEFNKNITIHNCTFNSIITPTLKIGNSGTVYANYSSERTYIVGDKVKYDNTLWICNTKIDTPESWDETHWDVVENPVNVKAIIVDGCHFENSNLEHNNSSVIELGINSQYVTTENCTFDNNIIDKTNTSNVVAYRDNGVGSEFNSNTQYLTGSRCIFEHKYYIANTDISSGSEFNPSQWEEYQRYNYTDILDINTDERKLLRFKFTQPLWEYINYLTNLKGEVVLTVDGKDSEITAPNGLNITEDANGINIKSVKDGDVTLSLDPTADLDLAKGTSDILWKQNTEYVLNDTVVHNGVIYECSTPHISSTEFDASKWTEVGITQIIINKVLQLNDNLISNRSGSEDIKIEPATNKIIEIQQTEETSLPYEDKIVDRDDAIPNVAFVKGYATDTIIKRISQEDIDAIGEDGLITIGEFPTTQYSGHIHITGVTVNVRNPFYKIVPYLTTDSAEYVEGYTYYKGDVVKGSSGGTIYGVVKETHVAIDNNVSSNDKIDVIPTGIYTDDIKYADVVGIDFEGEYNLTETYAPNYVSYGNNNFENVQKIDIQKNNLFGYTNAEAFSTTTTYGLENKIVSFQDRNYKILKPSDDEGYVGERYESSTLHKTTSTAEEPTNSRLYDEGFVYTFDEDRNYNIGVPTTNNPYTKNYSAGKVGIKLYSSDGTLVTSLNRSSLLFNPAGDLIVKVSFVKEEL